MRVSELLNEGKRRKDLTYQTLFKGKSGEIDKIAVTLEGKDATKFTKLAREFRDLSEAFETAKTDLESKKDTIKDAVAEIFDDGEEVLTRIVTTGQIAIQLAKTVPPSQKPETDFEKAFNKLLKDLEQMVPELKDKVEQIAKVALRGATTVKDVSGKTGAVTVKDIKEGFGSDFMSVVNALRVRLAKWLSKYDKKLSAAQADLVKLQSMKRVSRKTGMA